MRSVKNQVWDPVYEIWYRVGDQALSQVPTSVWSRVLDPARNEVKDRA